MNRPSQLTDTEREQAIAELAAKPLEELREWQRLNRQQQAAAHSQRNARALVDLQAMEDHLLLAVDRKTFGAP